MNRKSTILPLVIATIMTGVWTGSVWSQTVVVDPPLMGRGITQSIYERFNQHEHIWVPEVWTGDLGVPYRYAGEVHIITGDVTGLGYPTHPQTPATPWPRDQAFGRSGSLDPTNGLVFDWLTTDDGRPVELVHAPHDHETLAPGGAITIASYIYAFMMDVEDWSTNPPMVRSELIRSVDGGATFDAVWTWGECNQHNKFVNISPVFHDDQPSDQDWVYLAATGPYRQSPIYLARCPNYLIDDLGSYEFFAGLDHNNNPIWGDHEGDAVPILDGVAAGELCIQWCPYYEEWLLGFFDWTGGGEFRFYKRPHLWGPEPWERSSPVMNAQILHTLLPDCESPYGGYFIEDHMVESEVSWVLSVWEPYNIVLLRTDLEEVF